ncbi:uncharacterized protein LOC132031933 [Lycium ferocissimum]|uniref:uncharacterized protein LOC132031933 n=1 Tax=Lycium ferocissimum TaxID=112874 RepID=UPI002814C92D|nr:uncharacterized protein LOC132031933 [Lycium ferocissimum]
MAMDTKLKLRDWAGVSDLILDLIYQKLPSLSDCLCFGAVCKPWFFFVSNNNYDALRQRTGSSSVEELPLLMIFKDRASASTANTSLYSVTRGKIVMDLEIPLGWTHRCCGSSHGWLAFQGDFSFALYNPFTREKIDLPRLELTATKVILSKNPSANPNDYEVMAMSRNWGESRLAILKPSSSYWKFVRILTGCPKCDVIYYDERYYVVDYGGKVFSIDNTTLKYTEIAPDYGYGGFIEFYLVQTTTNELLRVHILRPQYKPSRVKILKLVASPMTPESRIEQLDSLGDEALFLCQHSSMSVLASQFSGCKSNSRSEYCSVDIVHLQDDSFNSHCSFDKLIHDTHATMPPASWIIPTLKL